MNEVFFVQNGSIQDGKIQNGRTQDGCHHQVKWEWMSLSQIELVWVKVKVAWECFWVNLREDNKVSKSKMAVLHSNMEEFKMAAIIKLSQNEWVKFFFVQNGWIQDGRIIDVWHHQVESEWMSEVFFLFKMAESKMAEFKMSDIIKLSQNELVWDRVLCKIAESKMAVFKMTAIIKLGQNEWVKYFFVQNGWIQDGSIQDGWHHQVR